MKGGKKSEVLLCNSTKLHNTIIANKSEPGGRTGLSPPC